MDVYGFTLYKSNDGLYYIAFTNTTIDHSTLTFYVEYESTSVDGSVQQAPNMDSKRHSLYGKILAISDTDEIVSKITVIPSQISVSSQPVILHITVYDNNGGTLSNINITYTVGTGGGIVAATTDNNGVCSILIEASDINTSPGTDIIVTAGPILKTITLIKEV